MQVWVKPDWRLESIFSFSALVSAFLMAAVPPSLPPQNPTTNPRGNQGSANAVDVLKWSHPPPKVDFSPETVLRNLRYGFGTLLCGTLIEFVEPRKLILEY